jgi:alkylation response protein AidB-like acyl-CoA dehydrogenase
MSLLVERVAVDGQTILANARGIAPVLREEANENERCRQLTPRAVSALRSTGVFRMPMPRAWGGPEVDICTQAEIIEELSAADGSAGWCAMVGSDAGFYTAAIDDEAAHDLYPHLDGITAGWIVPAGKLHRAQGGYVLEGRWQFGSGCTHADVIVGGALVYEDGALATMADGRPEIRVAMLAAEKVEILDTWYTTGLAGSGSNDYHVANAFVPAEHTFRFGDLREPRRNGVLYSWPGMFFANLPAVPLGIARAALDAARELLADKILIPELRPAREDRRVCAGVAEAHVMVGAVRRYLFDVLGELWSTLEMGVEPSLQLRAELLGAYMHTIRTCRDAVRILADVVGSASIYRHCPIERHLRDLTTISQHLMGQPKMMEMVGALLLGDQDAIAKHPLSAEGLI